MAHLWLIDWNLWPFPARSANSFMNIFGFIDDHFWPKKREAQKTKNIFGFIDDHFWPKKARSAKTKNIYISLMLIFD